MNDFSELEAQLKALRPAAPSADLIARVEQALQEAPAASATVTAGVLPRRKKPSGNWFALGFGLAAAAALLLLARVSVDRHPQTNSIASASVARAKTPVATQPTRNLVPDGITRVVYGTSDEGLVYPAYAKEPVRRVRSRSRETLHWKDPGSGASLRVSYPTEDVELIPVSLSGQ